MLCVQVRNSVCGRKRERKRLSGPHSIIIAENTFCCRRRSLCPWKNDAQSVLWPILKVCSESGCCSHVKRAKCHTCQTRNFPISSNCLSLISICFPRQVFSHAFILSIFEFCVLSSIKMCTAWKEA